METLSHRAVHELAGSLMDGHVSYVFGGKAKFSDEPKDIKGIDCSGFVRYFLYKATGGAVQMPDGSWNQNEWCKKQGFTAVDYATAAENDDWLRLAHFPQVGDTAGHVWFVLNGKTLESHGGKGPNRRAWDTKVLKDSVKHCYKLTQVLKEPEKPAANVAPLMFVVDLSGLREFFRNAGWLRAAAKLVQSKFVKADYGIFSPFSSDGYTEVTLGDPVLLDRIADSERRAIQGVFLAKAATDVPAGVRYLEFLKEEANGNYMTLRDLFDMARRSQQQFAEHVTNVASNLVRVKVTLELMLAVGSVAVPGGSAVKLAEGVAVAVATNWRDGPRAVAFAVGGELAKKGLKMGLQKAGKAGATHYLGEAAGQGLASGIKVLFVAKEFADKIPVLVDPTRAFDP